jgi:acetyl esterase/lipase
VALPQARGDALAVRELPARSIPVPDTVSPEMQKLIAAPLPPAWNVIPATADEWRRRVGTAAEAVVNSLPAVREALHVRSEPLTLDGVKAFLVTPETIPPENQNRLLIHVHGGCYVNFPGEAGTREAVYMASFGRFKVISVDYRMPPEHVYPAALDDAMTVWKAALKMADPNNMAIFGTSAGSVLTLQMILRAKQENLPLPAAIAPGTPMSDLPARATVSRPTQCLTMCW